jgi:hypothetical protein
METTTTYIKGDWYFETPARNEFTEKALAHKLALQMAGDGSWQHEIALDGFCGIKKLSNEQFIVYFKNHCTRSKPDGWWEFI